MEIILRFFTETLDGTVYIVAVILSVIFIFALIGFLAERKIKRRKEESRIAVLEREEVKQLTQDDITRQNTAMNMNESGRLSFGNGNNSSVPNSFNGVNGSVSEGNFTSGVRPVTETVLKEGIVPNNSVIPDVSNVSPIPNMGPVAKAVSPVSEVSLDSGSGVPSADATVNFTPNASPVLEARLVNEPVTPASGQSTNISLMPGGESVKLVETPNQNAIKPQNNNVAQ